MRIVFFVTWIILASITVFSQSKDAYQNGEEQKSVSLLDPSRFSIRHSLSFGAVSGSGVNDIRSQSLYTTMMQYRFTAPVTLNLNFSLPIHSTFSQTGNLTANNLQSLDYFKNMPFEASLNWQPTKNTLFQLSIVKAPGDYYSYYDAYRNRWDPFGYMYYHP